MNFSTIMPSVCDVEGKVIVGTRLRTLNCGLKLNTGIGYYWWWFRNRTRDCKTAAVQRRPRFHRRCPREGSEERRNLNQVRISRCRSPNIPCRRTKLGVSCQLDRCYSQTIRTSRWSSQSCRCFQGLNEWHSRK